ncbi:MFS transporter [Alphaproteobacteria bacterium 46_93_T64]|nr:MFS transporter [Alphaproteobacteria bacterium 46_93_T64]
MTRQKQKVIAVTLLALAQVAALSLWFSATALIPALKAEFEFSGFHAALLSSSVSIGFVLGTLCSATLNLADRFSPHRIYIIAAIIAICANGSILLFTPTSPTVIFLRLITGVMMAGLYPIGMKMVATWANKDTGLLVGLLVGALTLGSASPHLLNLLDIQGLDWKVTIIASSLLASTSILLIPFVKLGHELPAAPLFNASLALLSWRNKALRYANFGYFGHMWELYAMWAWIGIFLLESYRTFGIANPAQNANISTFATLAVGAIGCIGAGLLADKVGRTTVTMGAMIMSGTCAAVIGLFFGGSPYPIIIISIIWGITIVADSAQFSTCIIELSPPNMIGTMLTVQTCVGFLISLISIHLIPYFVESLSWSYAFAPLALGPVAGVYAMWKLRQHPDAVLIAGGRR